MSGNISIYIIIKKVTMIDDIIQAMVKTAIMLTFVIALFYIPTELSGLIIGILFIIFAIIIINSLIQKWRGR